MNMNAVADEILIYLKTKHARVSRNKPSNDFIFPYVVFRIESVMNSYPSEDLYLNVDIYEDVNKSAADIEDIADLIDNGLNHTVINTAGLNMQFERENRQYVSGDELVSVHLINLRYTVRVYFK